MTVFQLLSVSLETVVYSEYSITVLQGLLLHYLIVSTNVCTNADSVVCENILDHSTETFGFIFQLTQQQLLKQRLVTFDFISEQDVKLLTFSFPAVSRNSFISE